MLFAALRVLGAFAAALAVAGAIAFVRGLEALALAPVAIPFGLIAVALSEARRIRGLLFWLFAGLVIAWQGLAIFPDSGWRTLTTLTIMGLAGGFVYWRLTGRRAGRLAAEIARARGQGDGLGLDG